jgi:hypothetical protein
MAFSRLLALLLVAPAALAAVHRLPIHKLPEPASRDIAAEAAALGHKYGAAQRPFPPQSRYAGDDLYWTQDTLKGGNTVPLNSQSAHERVLAR